MLANLKTLYATIKSKSNRGRIIAGIVAATTTIATLSLASWIYVAMLAGAISIAGAAISIPGIIIMSAVIALCIYLVGVNADQHKYYQQNYKLNKHDQHVSDHAHDSTHASVQLVLNANPTTTDISPPSIPLLEPEDLPCDADSSNFYDRMHTIAEDRAPSPD